MSEYLGRTFSTGEPAPEMGTYQLMNDGQNVDERTILGRVIRVKQGDPLPPHPDTGREASWRFVRVDETRRGEAMHSTF